MFALMKRLSRFLILSAALLIGLQRPVWARSVVQTDQVRAELTAEYNTVAPGESLWLALAFTIKPNWHTYWRTPRDSGFPTSITWTLPEGITAGPLQWPPPERLAYESLTNFGYSNQVTMLTELTVAPGVAPADVTLKADATWLACSEICIPAASHCPLKLRPVARARTRPPAPQLPRPAPSCRK